MAITQNDPQVCDALQTITGATVVRYPIGNDTSGNTIYQAGYVKAGSAENPEYCFDNQLEQRCSVPVHRVEELLKTTVQAPKPVAGK